MSVPAANPPARRALLSGRANPSIRRDYVVELAGIVTTSRPIVVRLRYVPDRLVIDPASLPPYVAALAATEWPSLEALAAAVIDDLANELVPRWCQTLLTVTDHQEIGHSVLLEDRQPHWDNPPLLARLQKW